MITYKPANYGIQVSHSPNDLVCPLLHHHPFDGTVGYQVGLSGKNVLKIGIVLALTFSAVVYLIADLNSAGKVFSR